MADTTVNNESVNAVESFDALSTGTFNSHEAALAASVVEDYDAQIKEFTEEMEAEMIQKSQIQAVDSVVTTLASKTTTTDPAIGADSTAEYYADGTTEFVEVSAEDLADLIEQAQEAGIDLPDFLTSDYSLYAVRGMEPTVYAIPKDVLEELSTTCENMVEDLNQNSELKMIQFQSLLDARKQALLQLSNMISSDNETLLEIIRNMKG